VEVKAAAKTGGAHRSTGTEVGGWSFRLLQLLVVEISMVFVVDELESVMLRWQILVLAFEKVFVSHTFPSDGIRYGRTVSNHTRSFIFDHFTGQVVVVGRKFEWIGGEEVVHKRHCEDMQQGYRLLPSLRSNRA
jgi:hypothetical protein